MHEWVNLTTRLGETVRNPKTEQLREALAELFSSSDEGHPDSWIECGSQNGPLYSLSFFASGRGRYTKYSDVDMTDELEVKELSASSPEEALELWQHLIKGQYEKL